MTGAVLSSCTELLCPPCEVDEDVVLVEEDVEEELLCPPCEVDEDVALVEEDVEEELLCSPCEVEGMVAVIDITLDATFPAASLTFISPGCHKRFAVTVKVFAACHVTPLSKLYACACKAILSAADTVTVAPLTDTVITGASLSCAGGVMLGVLGTGGAGATVIATACPLVLMLPAASLTQMLPTGQV